MGVRERQYTDASRLRSPLARELYAALRSRSRHQGEAMSHWANALAEIITDRRGADAEEYVANIPLVMEPAPVESEAEAMISKIREVLGDDGALAKERAARKDAEADAAAVRATLRTLAELAAEDTK